MGYIKEPKNVDLVVSPSVLTDENKKKISDAIAEYHKTGKTSAVEFDSNVAGAVRTGAPTGHSKVMNTRKKTSGRKNASV